MTSETFKMLVRIQSKIDELTRTVQVLREMDGGPSNTFEHLLGALDELKHPANVKTLLTKMTSNGWQTESKNPRGLLAMMLRDKQRSGAIVKMGRGLWGKAEWAAGAEKLAAKAQRTTHKAATT